MHTISQFCNYLLQHEVETNQWKVSLKYTALFSPCSQLGYPGVKIENVDVGKLITYYDYFDIDLDNAVNVQVPEDGQYVDYRARQTRLNHKPFTYSINVTSDSTTDAYIRVFLGPKYDYLGREYNINDRRHYFVEIDRFPYNSKNWKA